VQYHSDNYKNPELFRLIISAITAVDNYIVAQERRGVNEKKFDDQEEVS